MRLRWSMAFLLISDSDISRKHMVIRYHITYRPKQETLHCNPVLLLSLRKDLVLEDYYRFFRYFFFGIWYFSVYRIPTRALHGPKIPSPARCSRLISFRTFYFLHLSFEPLTSNSMHYRLKLYYTRNSPRHQLREQQTQAISRSVTLEALLVYYTNL